MYGASPLFAEEAPRPPRQTSSGVKSHARLSEIRSISPIAFLLAFIVPVAIFIAVDCARTHQGADSSLVVTLCAAAVVLILAYPAWLSWRRRDSANREPSWSIFLLCCCIIAWVLAAVLGSVNYALSSELREYEKLEYYVDVDANKGIGQGVQDAGRVFFLPGAHLDLNKSMSFMSSTNYCVAPIVSGDALGARYDFWAVGTECCGTKGINYTCGDYNTKYAAAGLRDLDESARVYYRLAVEAAEAAYDLSVKHPVFLIWMADPVGYLTDKKREAGSRLLEQICLFAVFQFFAVLLAAVVLAKAYLLLGPAGFK
jgi:hypothetical protein